MRSEPPRRKAISRVLLLTLPVTLYVCLAARLIRTDVGYQYDEALYVESAVYMLHGSGEPPFMHDAASWINAAGRRWPLMIIPYVGATKAYVALPLFAAFGIGARVARFVAVLLGSLGIAGLAVLIGAEAGSTAGLIAGMALAIHPSYLDFTVFDNGGVSVWMAGMGLVALALTLHLKRRSTFSALLLGAAAGLGVWARANLLWLIAAVILASLFTWGRRAVVSRRHIAAMLAGGFLGLLPLTIYEVNSRLATLRFMSSTRQALSAQTIAQRFRALGELMISDSEQRAIWAGPALTHWEMGIGGALLLLVVCSLFVRIRPGDPETARWRRACALSAVLLTVMIVTSSLGISQHHLVAVLPLAVAALAILSVEVVRRSRAAILPLAAAGAGLAVLCLSWDARIESGLRRTGGIRVWSSAIDGVHQYLGSHPVPPDRLKILSWGFQNNLYVISGGDLYGTELFWAGTEARSPRGIPWGSEIAEGGSFLLYSLRKGSPRPWAAAKGFWQALEGYGGPRRDTTFLDRSGSPLAVLVEIGPAH
jgi:hypothetical protein